MSARRYVIVVPDGGGDRHRSAGLSPLEAAHTPCMDFLAREGVSGLMRTLYGDLPRESLVAQLGMLGWEPHRYYPGGRASCELLAVNGMQLADGDLAFRANLVRMEGRTLASYNADYIGDAEGAAVVERLRAALDGDFPDIEIRHNSDFRTVLVLRGAGVLPRQLVCPEPHECQGMEFDPGGVVKGTDAAGDRVAARINAFLREASRVMAGEPANALFPWSASLPLRLPPFRANTGFTGPAAVVGAMDFLCGIALAGGMEFRKVGNGRPETDYAAKGETAVRLLEEGHELVYVHVNAPDEAAHMGDVELKIRCLESIDAEILRPIVEYFRARPQELGGVVVVPDHYTNCSPGLSGVQRCQVHSTDPVPFALWNGRDRDAVTRFGEGPAAGGRYANAGLDHLALLAVLGAVPARSPAGFAELPAPHAPAGRPPARQGSMAG